MGKFETIVCYEILGAKYPSLTMEMWGQTVPLSQVGQRFVTVNANPWIDDGRTDYQNMHNDVYTGLLYTIRQQIGWVHSLVRFMPTVHPRHIPPSDESKVELWANTLSDYAGRNFNPIVSNLGFSH